MVLSKLLEGLKAPEAYREIGSELGTGTIEDGPPIEVRQTHISVVFLVGEFAWKVKKPVDLGFLDFSTLAKRRRFCEEELRINRRTAPAIYHGLDSIVRDRDGSLRVTSRPGDREVLDVAVRMKRLPESGLLDGRLNRLDHPEQTIEPNTEPKAETNTESKSGPSTRQDPRGCDDQGVSRRATESPHIAGAERRRLADLLTSFASDLAAFHAACPTGVGIDEHGGPDGMRRQFEENLGRLMPFSGDGAGDVISADGFLRLRTLALDRLEAARPRLERRVAEGRVREGHGDLHAGNLCEVEGRLLAFDAIEFDRRLRCRDVAAEVAHLAMDLDRRGLRVLAARWTRAYVAAAGDSEVGTLAPLFRFHYAIVRTLVESIRSRDEAVEGAERAESVVAARRYANLATGYLLPPSLVFTCGLQGTGKSTLARAIAVPLRALVLRSDVVRKRLAGVGIDDRRGLDRHGESLYGEAWTAKTYAALRRAAAAGLRRGRHVVVDAACTRASQRAIFAGLAAELGTAWVVAETHCDRDEVRRRLAARSSDRREASDADWAVYEAAERAFESPQEIPTSNRVAWPSEGDPLECSGAVVERLLPAVPPTGT